MIAWLTADQPDLALRSVLDAAGATDVFPDELRELTRTLGRPPLPPVMTIGARDEAEARDVLERLEQEAGVAHAYVSPPRSVLGGRIRPAGATAPTRAPPPTIDQWGLDAINWPSAARIDASGVMVGLVDTGVDRTHPELATTIESYANLTADSDDDLDGHGTHVAGIIVATGTRPLGIAGVCNARLRVYKAFGRHYRAPHYYRALAAALLECRVVNLSLGGPPGSLIEERLIEDALAANVVIVAAAGNSHDFGDDDTYPAKLPGVIAVGAADRTQTRAAFSCVGPHVTLCAPGVEIWSTSPLTKSSLSTTVYASKDGSSMAAPFVTATVAMLLAGRSGLSPARVAAMLRTHSGPPGGRDDELGNGILDLQETLAQAPPP